jgi:SAM-dependent methyltransferase
MEHIEAKLTHDAHRKVELLPSISSLLDRYVVGRYVLDVGCANYEGQYGFGLVHSMVLERCAKCVGIDVNPAVTKLPASDKAEYFEANAETFRLKEVFDTIFCGDVIEHLSNPGLFLDSAQSMMASHSNLILVTPNPYGLRSIIGLLRGFEPPSHVEHTILLPRSGIRELAHRYGLRLADVFLIKGQVLMDHDRFLARAYKLTYHALLRLPGARKFADTFAFRLVKAS